MTGPGVGRGSGGLLAGLMLAAAAAAALAAAASLFAGAAAAQGPPHLAMRLVAESVRPRAGSSVMLAIDTRPQPGWHGYWRNPGDAGFPATLAWAVPPGASVGAVEWPVPTTLLIAGLMNHVYAAPYAPLVALHVPRAVAPGTRLPVGLSISYLVCTATLCVPEAQTLRLDLEVGDGAPSPDAAAFAGWRRAIPKPLGVVARYQRAGSALTIQIPYPRDAALEGDAHFFAESAGVVDHAAPQRMTRSGDRLIIATRGGAGSGPIAGVLRIGPGNGLAIRAVPGRVAAIASGGEAGGWRTALLAMLGALLGGLVLNAMPCVFPILSLKALGLIRSGAGEHQARREALGYAAGAVLACTGLGAAILGLRAGGAQVGWAFQLQDPRMIVLLLLLATGIALNLAGLFEVPTPRFARGSAVPGAFATGALAAFVATPCTGPFMAAALGAALVLPWYAAIGVFAGLGLGLALPFLALGFVPALRRRLPRPGAWMETLKRILSVPMWLTAIALGWVLGRQVGSDGLMLALAGALAAGLLLWLGGRRQRRGRPFGWGHAVALVIVAALASGLAAHARPAKPVATADGQAFSEAKLAALRRAGRPVFVYFTADWCLTCKINERAVIDTAAVRADFARSRVAVLIGDWTDGDPALGRFIEAQGRAGVPLYLFYPGGGGAPRVLPQVLTPAMLEALR